MQPAYNRISGRGGRRRGNFSVKSYCTWHIRGRNACVHAAYDVKCDRMQAALLPHVPPILRLASAQPCITDSLTAQACTIFEGIIKDAIGEHLAYMHK